MAMANPRRISLQLHNHHSAIPLSNHSPPPATASISSIAAFLKRPSAFPFVLSLFLLLTWLCLRVQRYPSSASLRFRAQSQNGFDADTDANLGRFSALSLISRDRRGWLFNPISVALDKGIHGGAQQCKSIHAGEIRPGGVRGNHRHHSCNETFLIWGAETKFRDFSCSWRIHTLKARATQKRASVPMKSPLLQARVVLHMPLSI